MHRSTAMRVCTALAVPLLLAACSASKGATSTTASKSPASAAASPSPSDPNAGLLTGTKLKSLLVTDMPPGFSLDSSGSADTGDTFQSPSSAPAAGKPDCSKLNGTAWVSLAGPGAVSFAQSDYLDSSKNEIAQEIDVYPGTTAQTVMSDLKRVFAECATFTMTAQGQTATVHIATSAAPSLGSDAIKAVMTSPDWYGGTTLVAARVGTAVVTAFYSTSGKSEGAQVVALATQIVQNVKSAQ